MENMSCTEGLRSSGFLLVEVVEFNSELKSVFLNTALISDVIDG